MNASMVPCEAASKQSNGWHDLATRKDLDPEPPAAPLLHDLRQTLGRALGTSSAGVQAVDIRHWIFGCAMTLGASTMAPAATAVIAPPPSRGTASFGHHAALPHGATNWW